MMAVIKFHFHENDGFFSNLVEWRTNSRFGHISVEVNGYYYQAYVESRFYRTTERPDDIVETISLEVSDSLAIRIEGLLKTYLGRLYDMNSVWGWLVNKGRQSKRRWYCSEMALTVLTMIVGEKPEFEKLISPKEIYVALSYYLIGLENKGET